MCIYLRRRSSSTNNMFAIFYPFIPAIHKRKTVQNHFAQGILTHTTQSTEHSYIRICIKKIRK